MSGLVLSLSINTGLTRAIARPGTFLRTQKKCRAGERVVPRAAVRPALFSSVVFGMCNRGACCAAVRPAFISIVVFGMLGHKSCIVVV